MPLPEFLTNKRQITTTTINNNISRDYQPLLGAWLLEMALIFDWGKPPRRGQWADIFTDADFCSVTGLVNRDDMDDANERPTLAVSQGILQQQLRHCRKEKLKVTLPLFKNVAAFAEMMTLTDADQALIIYAIALNTFSHFKGAISTRQQFLDPQQFCQLFAQLTGLPETEFQKSIDPDSRLLSTGIIRCDHGLWLLEYSVSTVDSISNIFMNTTTKREELFDRFLKPAASPILKLDNFPHLKTSTSALQCYLRRSLENNLSGVNILLYGQPGVGKTEYAKALAKEIGVNLYEIAFAANNGDPLRSGKRLQSYIFCQRLLSRADKSMLLFDEMEDVFSPNDSLSEALAQSPFNEFCTPGKAWINRTLESNPVPTIWISNRIDQVDPAYLRRFDYSIKFPIPPKKVRLSIAEHHLSCFMPPRSWLEGIAANESYTPAQLHGAAKVAHIADASDDAQRLAIIEQTLNRSAELLGQKRVPARAVIHTSYQLDYLNTDLDIPQLVAGLKRTGRGTFCFYGEAGTGKSELARYMADEIDKPLIMRRASDILSMWVGESEKLIADMFAEAREQDAVLVLDEADSFLADRRDAQRSWEVTQVNELLTQMEAFSGIFICTTNLMEKLDQASLRRFAFKVKFSPLTPDQRWSMFCQELQRLGGHDIIGIDHELRVRNLDRLTPGDFAVAARQFELWDEPATSEKLYEQLRKECAVKGARTGKIGFGG